MWPFRQRQQRDLYLTPEMVERANAFAKDNPNLLQPVNDVGDIVLVMVRDHDLALIPSLLAKVVDCAQEKGFSVETVMSSLVLIAPYPFEKDTVGACQLWRGDRAEIAGAHAPPPA